MTIRGWGEVLRYFHIYLGLAHYWGGGSLRNQTFFSFFFFWGGGGSFLYILGLFKVKIQNWNIFWTAKFQIYLCMPDIPDFFFFFFFWGGGGKQ